MELTLEDYLEIYTLLDPGPLSEIDCGTLCKAICCQTFDRDLGMYLLPGEEKIFTSADQDWLSWEIHNPQDYDFPLSWIQPVYYAKCLKPCPREKRPIQCRTFPLAPHLTMDGNLQIIWETLELPYQCPLIEKKSSLNSSYVEGLQKAWSKLIKNNLIRDLVRWDSWQRESNTIRLYGPKNSLGNGKDRENL